MPLLSGERYRMADARLESPSYNGASFVDHPGAGTYLNRAPSTSLFGRQIKGYGVLHESVLLFSLPFKGVNYSVAC